MKKEIYFDNAATTRIRPEVAKLMVILLVFIKLLEKIKVL